MIQALIGPIAGLAGSWLESKVEQTKAKGAVAKAKAEAEAEVMKTAATHDSKWELIMAQSTQSSFKDEIVTVIVLIPVVLVFIPGMEDVVKNGFDRLNELPDWYQYLVFLVCSAALGIKGLDKFRKK
jgi:hypothetical protein